MNETNTPTDVTASPTMEPTLDEQIKYFKFIVSTDDPLGPESAAMHRAILASLRAHADQAADARRLDWLDKQGMAYGYEDVQEGNSWGLQGPFNTARAAIDAAISAGKEK